MNKYLLFNTYHKVFRNKRVNKQAKNKNKIVYR